MECEGEPLAPVIYTLPAPRAPRAPAPVPRSRVRRWGPLLLLGVLAVAALAVAATATSRSSSAAAGDGSPPSLSAAEGSALGARMAALEAALQGTGAALTASRADAAAELRSARAALNATRAELGGTRAELARVSADAARRAADTARICTTLLAQGALGVTATLAENVGTLGAWDFEFFAIDGEQYLVTANSASGSNPNINSHIYRRIDGRFVPIQDILTSGARDWEYFSMDGDHFLVVANFFDGSRYAIDSRIYKWDFGTRRFKFLHEVRTSGAIDWEAFVIEGRQYLAVANHRAPTGGFTANSQILAWSAGAQRFEVVQLVPAAGAADWEYFEIDGVPHLALASYREDGPFAVNSVVYAWSAASRRFVAVQQLPTRGAHNCEVFVVDGETYLAVANHFDGRTHNIASAVYRWSRAAGGFQQIQSIGTNGATDIHAFAYGGVQFLAVANFHNDGTVHLTSRVFAWSRAEQRLVSVLQVPTSGAYGWATYAADGAEFLAVANHYGDVSRIYRLSSPPCEP